MLARSTSAKHLVNTFHLQDHHGRNTKISRTGGHEYALRAPTFPLGSDRRISMSCCCISSRAVFSLCIPCCPAAQQQQAPSSAGFNLTKGLALLVPPKDSLRSVDSNSSSTREGSREVTMCWREARGTPTAIFSLGSEEEHTVHMFICLSACPSVSSILSSPTCSVIFESIVQFQPKLIDNSKLMRSHTFHENQMLGRGERSKCCCSELNSFLFVFGFQKANLHRCAGQTAGMCQDWEQTQHLLPHLTSNVGTRKGGRCLGLGIEDAKETWNPSILHDYPYQSCQEGLTLLTI